MSKKQKMNGFVPVLFIIYMALLIWIILFKLQFSIDEIDRFRSINLIPFYYENEIGFAFHIKEVIENFAIFIPMGIYLSMMNVKHNFTRNVMLILGTSIALEVAQYVLSIGRSDITDLLTNTVGGIIGIGVYCIATKVFRSKKRADMIITIVAAIVTVVVVSGLLTLIILN